jgi:membrane protein required for colicin V production
MDLSEYLHFYQKFNVVDYIFIVIILFTFIRGLFTGFSRSVLTLIGIIVAFVISANFHLLFAETLLYRIQDALIRNMISSVLIFFSVYLFFWIIAILFDRFFKLIGLGWLNTTLGGCVGALKGIFVCAILIFSITLILSPKTPILNKSYFYPMIGNISKFFSTTTKEDLKEKFLNRLDSISQKSEENKTMAKERIL